MKVLHLESGILFVATIELVENEDWELIEKSGEKNYGGFVSLEPKTELTAHYKIQYGFDVMGRYLFTELANSERLIQKYHLDE